MFEHCFNAETASWVPWLDLAPPKDGIAVQQSQVLQHFLHGICYPMTLSELLLYGQS
jgi:hypothetical protein